jgi:hypothetical protein
MFEFNAAPVFTGLTQVKRVGLEPFIITMALIMSAK